MSKAQRKFIGIEEEIAILTTHFCHSMSISVFFNLQFQTSLKYLQSMNIFFPGSVITLTSAIVHPLWCYILIFVYDLNVIGAGFAIGITQFINFTLITIYIHIKNPCPESYFYFRKYTFRLRIIVNYFSKAIPAAIMFCADYIGFEILTFLASFLGPIQLASNVCLFNFISITYMLQLGLSITATTLVGNSIGAQNKKNVIKYSTCIIIISLFIATLVTVIIILFRREISTFYTDQKDVSELVYDLLGIYILFSLFDAFQVNLLGIIKGLGKQKVGAIICLIVLSSIG